MSYFDISDAEGVDFDSWVEEHEEDRRYMASLEAAGPGGDNYCSQCGEEDCIRDGHCTGCGSYEPFDDITEVTEMDLSGFDAAEGGEEEDVQDPDRSHITDPGDSYSLDAWIKAASAAELKRASYAIDREVETRKAALAREAKELEAFDKPVRATRSDKGTTRAPKAVNGNAEAKEGAA